MCISYYPSPANLDYIHVINAYILQNIIIVSNYRLWRNIVKIRVGWMHNIKILVSQKKYLKVAIAINNAEL